MESGEIAERAIRAIRLEFAKYSQQANCNFQATRKCIEGACPTVISQEILYSILMVDSSNRTQWMISTLVHLVQKYSYFQKHPEETEECCRYLQYKKAPTYSEIIKYGSDPDYFYILLQGEVSVFIKRTIQEIQEERRRVESKSKEENYAVDPQTLILNKAHFIQKGVSKFKFVDDIKEGGSFGELGMLYNKPRMAMLVAKTPCVFGILKKQDYLSVFYEQQKKLRNQKRKFISEGVLVELKNLRYEAMQGILYKFEQKRFRINQFLFKQNDTFSSFYIVYQGEVLLFNWIGRFKKPIARIGQGGVIGSEQLKKFLVDNQLPTLKYSAEVSSCSVILYKLQVSQILKMCDYRQVFGSIIRNLPEPNHERLKTSKPTKISITESSESHTDETDLKLYLKSQMMQGMMKASKQSVNECRLKRKHAKKQNIPRETLTIVSKFKLNILQRLNRNTQKRVSSNSFNKRAVRNSASSLHH